SKVMAARTKLCSELDGRKARCEACRGCSRRRALLTPRFGREAALGGSPSTGDRAYAAGLVSHPIQCGVARLRRLQFLASLNKDTGAIGVVRRGGPAVFLCWDLPCLCAGCCRPLGTVP